MRYFAELAYKGSNYHGWQRQNGQTSVQATLEDAFSTILQTEIAITGCGRTDSGVHASQYFIHFDHTDTFPLEFVRRINKFLPPDIAIYRIFEVASEAHARFDATHRAYEYHLGFQKNPFTKEICYHFPLAHLLNLELLQPAAGLLLLYKSFFPFCKTHTDVKTMDCELQRAEWEIDKNQEKLVFHIAANRFLRGMVRLIVGMCLNVAMGKQSLEEVKSALDQQKRLKKSWSVPPEGLFLKDIRYPYV